MLDIFSENLPQKEKLWSWLHKAPMLYMNILTLSLNYLLICYGHTCRTNASLQKIRVELLPSWCFDSQKEIPSYSTYMYKLVLWALEKSLQCSNFSESVSEYPLIIRLSVLMVSPKSKKSCLWLVKVYKLGTSWTSENEIRNIPIWLAWGHCVEGHWYSLQKMEMSQDLIPAVKKI